MTCTTYSYLNFVEDKHCAHFVAAVSDRLKKPRRRHADSAFSLHGLSTTESICMNDYFSTSHADMTLQDVIDAPNATIRANALKIAQHTINGTDTTSLVILDLEYPI